MYILILKVINVMYSLQIQKLFSTSKTFKQIRKTLDTQNETSSINSISFFSLLPPTAFHQTNKISILIKKNLHFYNKLC